MLVTDDPEGAEAALRKVWGGPLCVSVSEHTEAELVEIQDGLQGLPGLLSSGPQLDKLMVDVVWDDGTLQAWADAAYGEGLVVDPPRAATRPARLAQPCSTAAPSEAGSRVRLIELMQ